MKWRSIMKTVSLIVLTLHIVMAASSSFGQSGFEFDSKGNVIQRFVIEEETIGFRKIDSKTGNQLWQLLTNSDGEYSVPWAVDKKGNLAFAYYDLDREAWYIAKCNGTTGVKTWEKALQVSVGEVYFNGMAFDSKGDVVVQGYNWDTGETVIKKYKGTDGAVLW